MRIVRLPLGLASVLAASYLVGCGGGEAATSNAKPSADGRAYRLSFEPVDAKGVKELRETAKSDEDIKLIGRIGGDTSPWIDGQAAFLVVDPDLKACNEGSDVGCATPWDYCCNTDLLPTRKAIVKVVDVNGQIVAADARKLLWVKELQTVVVRGKAKRDDAGNLIVLAKGVYAKQ